MQFLVVFIQQAVDLFGQNKLIAETVDFKSELICKKFTLLIKVWLKQNQQKNSLYTMVVEFLNNFQVYTTRYKLFE